MRAERLHEGVVMERVAYLRGRRPVQVARRREIDVIHVHDDGTASLKAVAGRSPSGRHGSKLADTVLDELRRISMGRRPQPQDRLERGRRVYDQDASSYSLVVVVVDMLVMRFQIALSILHRLSVFGHDGLEFDCHLDA